MKLSILIPTIQSRQTEYDQLVRFLKWQINNNGYPKESVEILSMCDNKEMSVGFKRQQLYNTAQGEYSWMIDDDDMIAWNAIGLIMQRLDGNVDCVGFKELCIFDGKRVESSSFSLKYPGWMDNYDGFNHVRTPFFKTPIKTVLCRQVGVADMRFGEDHDFAMRIHPLLKTESYIDEFIYFYQHNSSPHNERYGIA